MEHFSFNIFYFIGVVAEKFVRNDFSILIYKKPENANVNNFSVEHKLCYIMRPSDYPEWIRIFAEYISSNDLTHLIHTSATTPILLSTTDKKYLVTLFTRYTTTTSYPACFAQKLTKS